jgi:hypothetical protein
MNRSSEDTGSRPIFSPIDRRTFIKIVGSLFTTAVLATPELYAQQPDIDATQQAESTQSTILSREVTSTGSTYELFAVQRNGHEYELNTVFYRRSGVGEPYILHIPVVLIAHTFRKAVVNKLHWGQISQ